MQGQTPDTNHFRLTIYNQFLTKLYRCSQVMLLLPSGGNCELVQMVQQVQVLTC